MYGVIIEKGPQNWQILQQENGFATAELSGVLEIEEDLLDFEDGRVFVRAISENSGARIIPPIKTKPENGHWSVQLKLPAGGPYTIETYYRYNKNCEKRGDRIFHLGVGDIYVIAGQSNAVGVGKDAVNDPPDFNVHQFRLCGSWDLASHPLHDSSGTLFPLSQEKVQTAHSPWLNFARILTRSLNYPIGLIPATKGGIPLSCWDRAEDGKFFDNMLDILSAAGVGKNIKGILWYHGCNDTWDEGLTKSYLERFTRVCSDFRGVFGSDIPILTVQLNKTTCLKNQNSAGIAKAGKQWASIREAQRKASHSIPNLYTVPSIDCMVCDGIHNSAMSNLVIGERTANMALKYIYGYSVVCDAPDIEDAVLIDEKTVELSFKNVYDRLFADLNRLENIMLEVYDDNGKAELLDYDFTAGNKISLSLSRAVSGKVTVGCTAFNETGLMPYDLFSYLPIIPFSDITVRKGLEKDETRA